MTSSPLPPLSGINLGGMIGVDGGLYFTAARALLEPSVVEPGVHAPIPDGDPELALIAATVLEDQGTEEDMQSVADEMKSNNAYMQNIRNFESQVRKIIDSGHVSAGEIEDLRKGAAAIDMNEDVNANKLLTLLAQAQSTNAANKGTSGVLISVTDSQGTNYQLDKDTSFNFSQANQTDGYSQDRYKPLQGMLDDATDQMDTFKSKGESLQLEIQVASQAHATNQQMISNLLKRHDDTLNAIVHNLA